MNSSGWKGVDYDKSWKLIRLRRYISTKPETEEGEVQRFKRSYEISFNYGEEAKSDDKNFNLSVISQISTLPYYHVSDGYIKVIADEQANVRLTLTLKPGRPSIQPAGLEER